MCRFVDPYQESVLNELCMGWGDNLNLGRMGELGTSEQGLVLKSGGGENSANCFSQCKMPWNLANQMSSGHVFYWKLRSSLTRGIEYLQQGIGKYVTFCQGR